MKKAVSILMTAILCAGMFVGCGSKNAAGGSSSVTMKEGQTVQSVVDQIVDEIGMQMPAQVEDSILKDMFYIDPAADADEYYGQMAMTMTSADNVIGVKAKADKKQTVVDGLNKRLSDVQKSFEQYLPDQSEKAKKGQVIEKGDYVFLIIIGQDETTFDSDMTKAKEIIDAAF